MLLQVPDVGEFGIFPFTINRANTVAYVCLGKTVGLDIVDLKAGKVLHRLVVGSEPIRHRTHGVALTPDETELWLSDQVGKKLCIYDATKMPPQPKGSVDLSIAGHGWVTFSLDGMYAYSHAPDFFDARTKQHLGTFTDDKGKPFASSKFIEVHFRDGKVVQMG